MLVFEEFCLYQKCNWSLPKPVAVEIRSWVVVLESLLVCLTDFC
jgi:hypothetical protein